MTFSNSHLLITQHLVNNRDIYWEDIRKSLRANVEGTATTKNVKKNLTGKVALVTGGGKGVGRAVTENFLQQGADVVIITRGSGADLAQLHPHCHLKICDVRDAQRVKEVVAETVSELGRLDMLINCAGYAFLTSVKEESEELFDKIMDINFKGVRNCIVAAAAELEKTKGCIISLGSIWGLPGTNLIGDSTYSAGDAAIIKYSEVIAEELPSVRVNTVSPALINTSMNDDMSEKARMEFAKKYQGRDTLFEPEEITEVVALLAQSDLTQKNIIVDAGYTQREKK